MKGRMCNFVLFVTVCLFVFANLTYGQAQETVSTTKTTETTETVDPTLIVLSRNGSRRILNDSLAPREENEDTFLPILQGEIIQFNFGENCSGCYLESGDTGSIAVIGDTTLLGVQKNRNVVIRILKRQKNDSGFSEKKDTDKEIVIKGISNNKKNPFIVRVIEKTTDQITSETTFLSYRDVRDNFGKRVANTYVVVQLTINNQSPNNQFFVQDIGITLDPGQCSKLDEYYKTITPYRLNLSFEARNSIEQAKPDDSKFNECINYYEENFMYPTPVTPVSRETVLAVGKASDIRSKRKIGFAALRFVADMGSVLTGLRLLGSDGVKGFAFLGTTVFSAADTAIPNVSGNKYENLQKSLPEGPLIVNTRSAKVVNLFIPLDRVFSYKTWQQYTRLVKNGDTFQKGNSNDDSAFRLKLMTEMFLVSQVEGVLINDNAPRFTLRPGGGLNNVDKLTRQ